MKSFNITIEHLQGLNTYGEAMEYLQQFSVKQLRKLAEDLGLSLEVKSDKKTLKHVIYIKSLANNNEKCTCGSRLTTCVCK